MEINITPQYTQTNTISSSKIAIFVTELKLFESVSLDVHFYDSSANYVFRVESIKLVGSNYDNWGTDDNYIINKVIEILNQRLNSSLTRQQTTPS